MLRGWSPEGSTKLSIPDIRRKTRGQVGISKKIGIGPSGRTTPPTMAYVYMRLVLIGLCEKRYRHHREVACEHKRTKKAAQGHGKIRRQGPDAINGGQAQFVQTNPSPRAVVPPSALRRPKSPATGRKVLPHQGPPLPGRRRNRPDPVDLTPSDSPPVGPWLYFQARLA